MDRHPRLRGKPHSRFMQIDVGGAAGFMMEATYSSMLPDYDQALEATHIQPRLHCGIVTYDKALEATHIKPRLDNAYIAALLTSSTHRPIINHRISVVTSSNQLKFSWLLTPPPRRLTLLESFLEQFLTSHVSVAESLEVASNDSDVIFSDLFASVNVNEDLEISDPLPFEYDYSNLLGGIANPGVLPTDLSLATFSPLSSSQRLQTLPPSVPHPQYLPSQPGVSLQLPGLSPPSLSQSPQDPRPLDSSHSSQEPAEPAPLLQTPSQHISPRSRLKHDRQFKCTSCTKVFPRRCDLNKHAKSHERPFKCDIAGCTHTQGFALHKDLRRHIDTIHLKSTFTCHFPGCGETFSRSDNCHRHFEEQHSR
ncbi:hypothetical protein G7Y89_g6848 [Cudoniella acicularis]|uniref:C2H2 type master regulator of conidiophore development brlA n=1 Tax=Cudoniella acicularis TaxID=354080 RepID=A0A8H4RJM3_9HELO|nr:hypothetical protein G7Y89_g6848 [Cudoniella acicularis]